MTPSHLLIGRRGLSLPDHLSHTCEPGDEDFDIDSTQLTRRMKHLSNTLNHFWKQRHLLEKSSGKPQVSVGDMVIVHYESLPRSFWKLTRIKDLIVGRDGQTRGATVGIPHQNPW